MYLKMILKAKLIYSGWYFGHYHDNLSYNDAELLYEAIKELGSVGYLQKVDQNTEQENMYCFPYLIQKMDMASLRRYMNMERKNSTGKYPTV